MSDGDADKDATEPSVPDPPPVESEPRKSRPPWLRPLVAGVAILVVAGAVGFGIGYLARPSTDGPELSMEEVRDQTREEISREMARQGFEEGKRAGRSHGIIAGGMAAESAVTIEVREQKASQAQADAAAAQAELAGISSGPPAP